MRLGPGGSTAASEVMSTPQVTALVERHRFLRSVCLFHTASEEEVRQAVSRPTF